MPEPPEYIAMCVITCVNNSVGIASPLEMLQHRTRGGASDAVRSRRWRRLLSALSSSFLPAAVQSVCGRADSRRKAVVCATGALSLSEQASSALCSVK